MMKVLLKLFFLTICLSEISFGQIQKPITKGCFLSGGSLSFSSDKTKDFQSVNVYGQPSVLSIRTQSFQTNLSLGYFAFNHLAFGIKTSIVLSIETYTVDIVPSYILKLNNSTLIVGPFIRYSSNLGLFVEGSAGIGLIKYEDNYTNSKYKNYSFDISVGYSIFVSNSVAIEPVIKYGYLNSPTRNVDIEHEIKNGLTAGIGFQIYFANIKSKNKN